jgi:hypothetical protein
MQALKEDRLKFLQLHPPHAKRAYPQPYESLMKLRIVALLLAIGMALAACAPKPGGGGAQATVAPTSTPSSGGGMDY